MPRRAHYITSGEIREIIFTNALLRLKTYEIYEGNLDALDDEYQSIMLLGPPGVGKSALQKLAALDVARYLSEIRNKKISVEKVTMRISNEAAVQLTNRVVKGEVIPYLHLYLPQTKIWHLEGTPSPQDNYVSVNIGMKEIKLPVNLWRLDAFFLPFLDYTDVIKDKNQIVPAFLVLDEFNMARKEVLDALFQLARSAELGRAKLNPFTVITLIGNTPETNVFAARQLAAPLVDRAQNYIVSRPTVDGWMAFMNEIYGNKWLKEIGAYLALNPRELYVQDPSDPTVVQTPRGWTQVSIKLYTLKALIKEGVINRSKYWTHAERILRSTLIDQTASEIIGFLRGLFYVNIDNIIKHPEELKNLDRNVAAYVLVKIASSFASKYPFEKDERKKEKMLETLGELAKYGKEVIGVDAVSLILSALPVPMQIALYKKVPPEIITVASETRKVAEELEEVLGG